MRQRINFWLTILGVVAYLSQPVVFAHEYHKTQPILSSLVFEN